MHNFCLGRAAPVPYGLRAMKIRLGAQFILGLIATLQSSFAFAYFDFAPTEAEFALWPEYCAVQYSFIMRGRNEFGDRYSLARAEYWRDRIGEHTFLALHHYCSSIHLLSRAKASHSKTARDFLLRSAYDEATYTITRADPNSIVYPDMVITLAMIDKERGNLPAAVSVLEGEISSRPTETKAYTALAIIYKSERELPKAKAVLVKANAATDGQSADVQYTLGLIQLAMGDVDGAAQSAHRAYKLGYPLPWLRNKLKSMGRWNP